MKELEEEPKCEEPTSIAARIFQVNRSSYHIIEALTVRVTLFTHSFLLGACHRTMNLYDCGSNHSDDRKR